ncbi:MAG: hypothetical protein V3V25_13395 [Paracoccaceae bacterium]
MKQRLSGFKFVLVVAFLAGCSGGLRPGIFAPGADDLRPVARPDSQGIRPSDNATSVEEFDTTTEVERQAALTPQNAGVVEQNLGNTVASLGNPTDPGFWLETPLVSIKRPGRVVYGVTGTSVAVELIPISGPDTGGSRISLPALRLLGAPLAGLPVLTVYSR